MSETIKWSFSADRCFRQCQRHYFLSHVAAYHSAKDPIRREAFLRKQVKTLELWQGTLVHAGIEKFVAPYWQLKTAVDWRGAIEQTQALAKRQLTFSVERRYRDAGMTKTSAGDEYCALSGHETGSGVSDAEFQSVLEAIETSLRNLSQMTELLSEIDNRTGAIWCEHPIYLKYDAARLEVHLDLMFFRDYGNPTIIDWKVSDSMGGSDANLQTGLYAWAMCQHYEWEVDGPEACELVEVQLLTNDIRRHQFGPDTFDRIENRIYRSVDAIQSLRLGRKYAIGDIEEFAFAHNPNNCALCSQQALCKQIVEQQKDSGFGVATDKTQKRRRKERTHEQTQPQLF